MFRLLLGLLAFCTLGPGQDAFLTFPLADASQRLYHGWFYDIQKDYHGAIDAIRPKGTPVFAAADGRAIASCQPPLTAPPKGQVGWFGNFILIDHLNGYSTLYAHLSEIDLPATSQVPCDGRHSITSSAQPIVYKSQSYAWTTVKRGDKIGEVGQTGASYSHLHFEVSLDGTGNYNTHAAPHSTRVDSYNLRNVASAYPPPAALCSSIDKSAYLWTQCPPVFAVGSSGCTPTCVMHEPRVAHTATLLNNGTVLVTGGYNGIVVSNTAEIFDPQSGTWRYTLHPMNLAREYHTAVKLTDGRVLVIGSQPVGGQASQRAEVFDPVTEQFTLTGTMNGYHADDPGILLANGKVLIIAGTLGAGGVSELYDPLSNSWATTPDIPVGAYKSAAVTIPDGRVLAIGGGLGGTAYSAVAFYDATTNSVGAMAPIRVLRSGPTATVLPDGRVLIVAGGDTSSLPYPCTSSTEIYDPTVAPDGASTLSSSLSDARCDHRAVSLPTGAVLVVGGVQVIFGGPVIAYLASAELRDPGTGVWTRAGSMSTPRYGHTATLLPNGRVLIVGGGNGSSSALASAELF